jgi:integrase
MLDGLLKTNILKDWTYQKAESAETKNIRKLSLDPFNYSEQRKILDCLEGEGNNLFQFAFWTGLRTSELVALEWVDIDLDASTVSVNKGMTQAAQTAEPPKTEAGDRFVKLLPMALEALISQKSISGSDGAVVFRNPRTQKPWTGDQPILKTLLMPALKKSGVRYRRPYQTRHTYASMMISAGEHIGWISSQLGHGNIGVTIRVYAKWLEETDPLAGSKAHELYVSKGGSEQL